MIKVNVCPKGSNVAIKDNDIVISYPEIEMNVNYYYDYIYDFINKNIDKAIEELRDIVIITYSPLIIACIEVACYELEIENFWIKLNDHNYKMSNNRKNMEEVYKIFTNILQYCIDKEHEIVEKKFIKK